MKSILKSLKDFFNDLDKLEKYSKVIMLTSTIALLLLVVFMNLSFINPLKDDLEDVSKKIENFEFNVDHHSYQNIKIASAHWNYRVLEELNASNLENFRENLKGLIIQSIYIVDVGDKEDTTELSKLNFTELAIISDEKVYEFQDEWNILLIHKFNLEDKLDGLELTRDSLILIFAIFQSIGLFLSFRVSYLGSRKN